MVKVFFNGNAKWFFDHLLANLTICKVKIVNQPTFKENFTKTTRTTTEFLFTYQTAESQDHFRIRKWYLQKKFFITEKKFRPSIAEKLIHYMHYVHYAHYARTVRALCAQCVKKNQGYYEWHISNPYCSDQWKFH